MENNAYLELFLHESQEILIALNKSLVQLEKSPADLPCFEEIFRYCHTLKGMAATMGYDKIVALAHALENILDKARKDKNPLSKTMIAALFNGADLLAALIAEVQQGTPGQANIQPMLEQLHTLLDSMATHAAATPDITLKSAGVSDTSTASMITATPYTASSIRVSLERLEALMNTVGELAIAKIRLVEIVRTLNDAQLKATVADVERITDRLQDEAMQIRLIPLEALTRNFPRLIRDLAKQENKEVALSMQGTDIGLDRTVLDEINDPLIQIIRNAVTHGIESPALRQKAGKPAQGTISIKAQRDRNVVVLEITDDGCGLDRNKIQQALIAQGLRSAEELSKLSEAEIFMLITLPGFSLRQQVSEGAGRGVGMSVVRNKIEAIGGSFAIQSQLGQGCSITLRLPLTLAFIHVLLIALANETFAIPLANIIETIKVPSHLTQTNQMQTMIPYRDGVLPLLSLREQLGFDEQSSDGLLTIVVCEIFKKKIGLVVDRLLGEEEVVVKNLTGSLREVGSFSGATILSSGRVALILDIVHLIEARTHS